MKSRSALVKMVTFAILLTLVVIFQMLATIIHFGPYYPALALIPITIGSILLGPLYGGGLGTVFAVVVLFGPDCAPFYAVNVPGTIVTVVAKGLLCGLIPGFSYKLLQRLNRPLACVVSSLLTPVVNTAVFIAFVMIFFQSLYTETAHEVGKNVITYLLLTMVGLNFVVEMAINAALSPSVVLITNYGFKRLNLETKRRTRPSKKSFDDEIKKDSEDDSAA